MARSDGFKRHRYGYYNRPVKKSRGIGEVYFNYAGIKVRAQEARSILYQSQDGQLTKIFRDFEFEFSKLVEFKKISSLETIEDIPFIEGYDSAIMHDFYIGDDDDAFAFSSLIIPMLKDLGWSITAEDGYIIEIIQDDAVEWYSDIEESEYDWFGLNLGVVVDGEKINILPLIVSYLKTIDIKKVKELPKDTKIPIQMSDGRTLMMPSQRLQGILNVLTELYDSNPLNENGELILSNLSASQLLNLEETIDVDNFSWLGSKKIKDLGKRLKEFTSVQEVIPPESFKATLRSYQQQGVNWLRFLNDFELGGILADDMGLGKTIQTLACLVIEQTKNPEKVSLIISPTSLVANWALEAAKFAPSLKVLVLHGSKRKQHFDSFNEYDVIITSYPLILRDEKVMLNQSFNYLVLDEAQFIKNASAKATKVIYKLKAKHRLCLSGTPIENHLGELWSQFRFLAPGLLGTAEKFRRLYQHPIEKSGNELRRNSLASRIKPFMLRRTKSEVAIDLPPKTEIIKTTSLEGPQLDLYESIRLAMDKKVREAISSQGLQRSHIIVLDALLKLRQTCCDPRLLKIESAKKAHAHSAKLKLLMDLVPNMIEEGRRILLFSQFSSMIKLIQDEFNKNNIEYVTLSGSTKDRRKPIESFQNKEVPVFLISLKAGGIGLNLTAADTIIHYDPWWNPAVENQATDRAHRIGQDKPVFVYKLITEGTVEEKILEMQNHKKSIVEGLLSENSNVKAPLRQEDLEELFKPLDGLEISA
ncbi:ATP-dependent helicase HepA (plasmid) [Piscirickettsia salmonis]|uniref:DEAD/DEAH box helicase n=1 Tax=Piscirickettsia salmonis TaxID=1238 RepID=UPI0012B86856|nr:DEAD/DEAH box helicase [Piscirickettsia salmonis]QGO21696.1 ATP-dependent helicase HepA [Piscirickettsia salmonis]